VDPERGGAQKSKPAQHDDNLPLNISLNIHSHTDRRELYCVALVGVILQFGVLVYSGFATYHRRLRFQEGGAAVQSYAFPITATGTLILVTGMLVCAHVVEGSTKEKRYEFTEKGNQARVLWLQRSEAVGDQSFSSVAIFAKETPAVLTKSRRNDSHQDICALLATLGTTLGVIGFITQFVGLRGMHWSATIAQLIATLLMTILRAWVRRGLATCPKTWELTPGHELDWLATLIESHNRDRLWSDSEPVGVSSRTGNSGFWYTLRKMTNGADDDDDHDASKQKIEISPELLLIEKLPGVARADGLQARTPLSRRRSAGWCWGRMWGVTPSTDRRAGLETSTPKAHCGNIQQVLEQRISLGTITKWPGPAAESATTVAAAIEIVLNAVFPPNGATDFTWRMRFSDAKTIDFSVKHTNGKWEANVERIEAILSLWLFAVHEEEEDRKRKLATVDRKQGSREQAAEDTTWLRNEAGVRRQNLRLFGHATATMRRDLGWWIEGGTTRVFEVEEKDNDQFGTKTYSRKLVEFKDIALLESVDDSPAVPVNEDSIEILSYRIMGFTKPEEQDPPLERSLDPELEESEVFRDDVNSSKTASSIREPDRNLKFLLATVSEVPLDRLFSQEIFSTFMWAVAKKLDRPIPGRTTTHSVSTDTQDDAASWKDFTLQNATLSRMVEDVHRTGLGSLGDIYMSIIPPLSITRKLPEAGAVIKLARQQARKHELVGHWKEAGDIYRWLFRKCQTLDSDDPVALKATAVLAEFWRTVSIARNLRTLEQHEEKELDDLKQQLATIAVEFRKSPAVVRATLARLYELQFRIEGYGSQQEVFWDPLFPEGDLNTSLPLLPALSGFTKSHELAHTPHYFLHPDRDTAMDPYARDLLDWTPLHYSILMEDDDWAVDIVRKLLSTRSDVNAKDLSEWTPLHYAAFHGKHDLGWPLLQEGADVNSLGRDGIAPLHCAAMNGKAEMLQLLLEAGANIEILDISRKTALHWAALRGQESIVNVLLQQGAHVTARDHHGRTPVHLAALSNSTETVRFLLTNSNLLLQSKDRVGRTPLHLAASNGHEKVVQMLVETLGVDKEARDNQDRTPLHLAAMYGHEKVVQMLVETLGANKEARDEHDRTPLHLAAMYGHEKVVQMLVETLGANKEALDNYGLGLTAQLRAAEGGRKMGQTPLHLAASNGRGKVVQMLVETLGADKEARDKYEQTPLHLAAENGLEKVVQMLVETLGADKETRDKHGQTPLHSAAMYGHEKVVQMLGETLDADKEACDNENRTPLHLAASNGCGKVVQMLVETLGADKVEACDEYGQTPLHFAAENGYEKVVQMLVETLGADKEPRDNLRRTPLHLAASNGHEKVVQMLVKTLGADKEARDNENRTPLHLAASNGHEKVVQMLVETLGADKEARDIIYKQTPLHLAAENGHEKVVHMLVETLGADKEARDNQDRTPLHLATMYGRENVVQMLVVTLGADKEARDENEQTPLDLARERRSEKVVNLLLGETERVSE
jgi:ankyrin repeat protein